MNKKNIVDMSLFIDISTDDDPDYDWMYVQYNVMELQDIILDKRTCRVCLQMNYIHDVKLIINTLLTVPFPQLMWRQLECGRRDDPDNGQLLCNLELLDTNTYIRYEYLDGTPLYKICVDANILTWNTEQEFT